MLRAVANPLAGSALPSNVTSASLNSITPTGGTLLVTGIQTITANSASAALSVVQSGAGPAAAFTGGNVLIGTTIDGVYRLDVNGPFRAGNSTFANMDVFGIQAITANSASPALHITQSGAGPDLQIDQAPTAETVVCTHTAVINLNGTDYKFPCVAA